MNSNEVLLKAISLNEERFRKVPSFDIYTSTLKQIHCLLSIVDGPETDKSKLDKIIVGYFAVREFGESGPELSEVLKKCQNIAFKLEMVSTL